MADSLSICRGCEDRALADFGREDISLMSFALMNSRTEAVASLRFSAVERRAGAPIRARAKPRTDSNVEIGEILSWPRASSIAVIRRSESGSRFKIAMTAEASRKITRPTSGP